MKIEHWIIERRIICPYASYTHPETGKLSVVPMRTVKHGPFGSGIEARDWLQKNAHLYSEFEVEEVHLQEPTPAPSQTSPSA